MGRPHLGPAKPCRVNAVVCNKSGQTFDEQDATLAGADDLIISTEVNHSGSTILQRV